MRRKGSLYPPISQTRPNNERFAIFFFFFFSFEILEPDCGLVRFPSTFHVVSINLPHGWSLAIYVIILLWGRLLVFFLWVREVCGIRSHPSFYLCSSARASWSGSCDPGFHMMGLSSCFVSQCQCLSLQRLYHNGLNTPELELVG